MMTFDEWNKVETARIMRGEQADVRRNVRVARSGGMARLMFWGDYVEWCEKNNVVPEGQWV